MLLPAVWLSVANVAMAAEPPPAASMFLVASRELTDPNFSQTVVLLLRYDEDGAMGVIVNRRTRALLKDAIPGLDAGSRSRHHVYLGGPVQLGTLRSSPDRPSRLRTPITSSAIYRYRPAVGCSTASSPNLQTTRD